MWTSEFTVDFTPLPAEMEEAYWAAVHYFAEVMFCPTPDPSPNRLPELEREGERKQWHAS